MSIPERLPGSRGGLGPALPGELAGHEVHAVPAHRAGKRYVCPECAAAIAPGTGHVVAWPEGRVDERRHWHHACWRVVARRGRLA